MSLLILFAAMSLAAHALPAHEPYVNVEDRLTAAQRGETGIDTLTPAQLARLNYLLRGHATAASRAPASAPVPAAAGTSAVSAPAAIAADASPHADATPRA